MQDEYKCIKNINWLNKVEGKWNFKLLYCLFSISSYFPRWNACKFTWTNLGAEFSVLFLVEVKSQKLNARKFERRYQQRQELGSGSERDEMNFLAGANHQSIHGRENWILLKFQESDDVISNTHGIEEFHSGLSHWNLKEIKLSQWILFYHLKIDYYNISFNY